MATAALSSVNKMPGVYDPNNFIGMTPEQQGAVINPTGAQPTGMNPQAMLEQINQTPGLLQALQGFSSQIEGGANPGSLLAQLLAQPITQV